MAITQDRVRGLARTLSVLVSLAALIVACGDPDGSTSDDDTPLDLDAGEPQGLSLPDVSPIEADASPLSTPSSILGVPDATADAPFIGSTSNPEAGGTVDATPSKASLESGVSVSVVRGSGATDAAATSGDARATPGITTSGGSDGGPCASGQSLCGSRCVDTSADPHGCGVCGHDCLGGACAGGQCQPVVVASGMFDAVGLAVDGTNAYFSAGGVVFECPVKGCGNAPTAIADYQDAVGAVTVDATTVYWTTADSVMACDIAGCGNMPTALATDLANPWGIAVDATRVYWTGFDDGTVAWLPLAGGVGATTFGGSSPQYVAVASERVYFTDVGDGLHGGVSAWAGGSAKPVVLASGASPSGIATDGATVFWTAGSPSKLGATVNACAAGGCGGTPDVLSNVPGTPQRLAVDGSGVYWANGDVYVLAAGSTTPVPLTSGQTATDIAVDGSSVYWIDVGVFEDSVMRVAK